MIHDDNQWHIRERQETEHGYRPSCATKVLTRYHNYNGILDKRHNEGTSLKVMETINRDYPYILHIYFKICPFPISNVSIPIESVKIGDIESACNVADDIYRAYCTEMVKYFTDDCSMLPNI